MNETISTIAHKSVGSLVEAFHEYIHHPCYKTFVDILLAFCHDYKEQKI